jgi:molybdopterin-biosynthesis enzyme MoeA-like protein
MIRIPEGAEALENRVGAALGAWVRIDDHVVAVLPGVPTEMQTMAEQEVLPRIEPGPRRTVEELVVHGDEADWYALLTRLGGEHPDVRIGSYPSQDSDRIVFRVTGSEHEVQRVIDALKLARTR